MLIYEVTLTVQQALIPEFQDYLVETHIPDMLATGCFDSASFEADTADGRLRVRYVTDAERLERYLGEFSEHLRSDSARRFPAGVEAARSVWRAEAKFDTAAERRDKLDV